MTKRCQLACDTPQGALRLELTLADEADIATALAAARTARPDWAIDWEQVSVGIYGRSHSRVSIPRDGDRIELYRALLLDPRASRRARAARAKSRP